MQRTVRIVSAPNRIPVRTIVARELSVTASDADALLARLPVALPRYYDDERGAELVLELQSKGANAQLTDVPNPASTHCQTHPALFNDGTCERCDAWICTVCRAHADGNRTCLQCQARQDKKSKWKQRRVAVLLVVLGGVALYAYQVTERRAARTDWDETLRVGLIVVEQRPVDGGLIDRLQDRIAPLETMLSDEAEHHGAPTTRPFDIELLGPRSLSAPVPTLPRDATFVDRARFTFALHRFLSPVDDELDYDDLDARVYLFVQPPADDEDPRFVEGLAELGGERGLVEVDLAEDTVDLALIAATHELFHLLGATDKYAADGSVAIPHGLADPSKSPRFPQTRAALMARLIATSPRSGELPTSFGSVVIGEKTAREIGWLSTD